VHDVVVQSIILPQLFITVTPHWLPQAAALFGTQQVPSLRQSSPIGHAVVLFAPQLTVRLQLLVAWPHCSFPQACDALSGMHPQTFAVHAPLSQSPQLIPVLQLSTVLPHRPTQ
jgi:hypothetical protein